MNVADVAALYRRYMDEPDQTFVDNAQMATFLSLAYDDFRSVVIELDPYVYAASHTVLLDAARTFDLSGILLGSAAPAATRLHQLVDIYDVESVANSNTVRRRLVPAMNLKSTYDGRTDYTLKGATLFFPGEYSGTIRIDYIPEQNVDWAAGVGGAVEYIDDLNRFHDLIALTAYLQYAIIDSAEQSPLVQLLVRRQTQLRAYLEGRSGGIIEHVADVEYV
jgi:acetolactate synthase small subunit